MVLEYCMEGKKILERTFGMLLPSFAVAWHLHLSTVEAARVTTAYVACMALSRFCAIFTSAKLITIWSKFRYYWQTHPSITTSCRPQCQHLGWSPPAGACTSTWA